MRERSLVLIKLGGSLLTDKTRPETPRIGTIRRLAWEIARAKPKMKEAILLGHGSGSFGHPSAQRFGLAKGIRRRAQLEGVAVTQAAAACLHRMVIETLLERRLTPFSLVPGSFLLARGGSPARLALGPLVAALDRGLLPVVYGDVVLDEERGAAIASTETVLLALARRLLRRGYAVSRALWVGETRGVYDRLGLSRREISAADLPALRRDLAGASGPDVTGGILHRVEAAVELARLGIPSWIFDGRDPGLLEGALLGEEVPGTRVVARHGRRRTRSPARSPRRTAGAGRL